MRYLLALFVCVGSSLFAEPPQAWLSALLPIGKCEKVQFSYWQQYRFQLGNWKLVETEYSLYAKRPLASWINGEVHYTLIYVRRPDETEFRLARRLELELNPYFSVTPLWEVKTRNRYELISRMHDSQLQRFRQKTQIVRKFPGCCLTQAALSHELFYNITRNAVDEYRFIPLELAFGRDHSYKFYSMLRWRRSDDWAPQYIWGFALDW